MSKQHICVLLVFLICNLILSIDAVKYVTVTSYAYINNYTTTVTSTPATVIVYYSTTASTVTRTKIKLKKVTPVPEATTTVRSYVYKHVAVTSVSTIWTIETKSITATYTVK